MRSSFAKAILATAIGLITATSAAYAVPAGNAAARDDSTLAAMGHDTVRFAKATWRVTDQVAMTVVHSPVIAYEVMRGERPLMPRTASREQSHREQIALTGHRTNQHYEPPPI